MNIANKISLFRVLSVPFFIACLIYYVPEKDYLRFFALGIFFLAVISDAIDGYIARKAKLKTKAGSILDPLADKLLLLSAFICLYLIRSFPEGISLPVWVTLMVVSRDCIILLGAVVIYVVKQSIEIVPTKWGKVTTIFQMLTVMAVLLQWRYSFSVWYTASVFTLISGFDYVRRGFKILYPPSPLNE